MKKILLLLTIISFTLMMVSCSSPSEELSHSLQKVKVKQLLLSKDEATIYPNVVSEIKYVDTLYKIGDTISLNNKFYVIMDY